MESRLLAPENPRDVEAHEAIRVRQIAALGHQTAKCKSLGWASPYEATISLLLSLFMAASHRERAIQVPENFAKLAGRQKP